jgi:single-strand DNA-binding protein
VVLWRSEKLAEYLQKGKQIYVEGRLQTRSYDDKDGKKVYATEVVADEVILLGGRGDGETASAGAGGGMSRGASRSTAPGGGMPAGDDDIGPMGVSDDDIPF